MNDEEIIEDVLQEREESESEGCRIVPGFPIDI